MVYHKRYMFDATRHGTDFYDPDTSSNNGVPQRHQTLSRDSIQDRLASTSPVDVLNQQDNRIFSATNSSTETLSPMTNVGFGNTSTMSIDNVDVSNVSKKNIKKLTFLTPETSPVSLRPTVQRITSEDLSESPNSNSLDRDTRVTPASVLTLTQDHFSSASDQGIETTELCVSLPSSGSSELSLQAVPSNHFVTSQTLLSSDSSKTSNSFASLTISRPLEQSASSTRGSWNASLHPTASFPLDSKLSIPPPSSLSPSPVSESSPSVRLSSDSFPCSSLNKLSSATAMISSSFTSKPSSTTGNATSSFALTSCTKKTMSAAASKVNDVELATTSDDASDLTKDVNDADGYINNNSDAVDLMPSVSEGNTAVKVIVEVEGVPDSEPSLQQRKSDEKLLTKGDISKEFLVVASTNDANVETLTGCDNPSAESSHPCLLCSFLGKTETDLGEHVMEKHSDIFSVRVLSEADLNYDSTEENRLRNGQELRPVVSGVSCSIIGCDFRSTDSRSLLDHVTDPPDRCKLLRCVQNWPLGLCLPPKTAFRYFSCRYCSYRCEKAKALFRHVQSTHQRAQQQLISIPSKQEVPMSKTRPFSALSKLKKSEPHCRTEPEVLARHVRNKKRKQETASVSSLAGSSASKIRRKKREFFENLSSGSRGRQLRQQLSKRSSSSPRSSDEDFSNVGALSERSGKSVQVEVSNQACRQNEEEARHLDGDSSSTDISRLLAEGQVDSSTRSLPPCGLSQAFENSLYTSTETGNDNLLNSQVVDGLSGGDQTQTRPDTGAWLEMYLHETDTSDDAISTKFIESILCCDTGQHDDFENSGSRNSPAHFAAGCEEDTADAVPAEALVLREQKSPEPDLAKKQLYLPGDEAINDPATRQNLITLQSLEVQNEKPNREVEQLSSEILKQNLDASGSGNTIISYSVVSKTDIPVGESKTSQGRVNVPKSDKGLDVEHRSDSCPAHEKRARKNSNNISPETATVRQITTNEENPELVEPILNDLNLNIACLNQENVQANRSVDHSNVVNHADANCSQVADSDMSQEETSCIDTSAFFVNSFESSNLHELQNINSELTDSDLEVSITCEPDLPLSCSSPIRGQSSFVSFDADLSVLITSQPDLPFPDFNNASFSSLDQSSPKHDFIDSDLEKQQQSDYKTDDACCSDAQLYLFDLDACAEVVADQEDTPENVFNNSFGTSFTKESEEISTDDIKKRREKALGVRKDRQVSDATLTKRRRQKYAKASSGSTRKPARRSIVGPKKSTPMDILKASKTRQRGNFKRFSEARRARTIRLLRPVLVGKLCPICRQFRSTNDKLFFDHMYSLHENEAVFILSNAVGYVGVDSPDVRRHEKKTQQEQQLDPIGNLTPCSIVDWSPMADEPPSSVTGHAYDSLSVEPVMSLTEMQCSLCGFRSYLTSILDFHFKTCHAQSESFVGVTCPCGVIASNVTEWRHHVSHHHQRASSMSLFQCIYCPMNFVTEESREQCCEADLAGS